MFQKEDNPYSMNAPLHLQTHKMPQTKRSSRMSDNLYRRKRVWADQPVNDPVLLPERDTNPEWGKQTHLHRRIILDVATEEADQTALVCCRGH